MFFIAAFSIFAVSAGYDDFSTKCTLESCDVVIPVMESDFPSRSHFVMYQTSQENGDRLTKYGLEFAAENTGVQQIQINPSVVHQTMLGFGGALTDAAAIVINKLTDSKLQDMLLANYYSKTGIEYSVGRVPISSCDFSTEVYSYDDSNNDYTLEDFSIEVDKTATTGHKISFIQRVLEMSVKECGQGYLKLFASPWAPPAWMTQTNSTLKNPSLRDEPEVYGAWARYFSKFFAAYKEEGINFWGVTVQNEPNGNTGAWQDLKMSAQQQLDFVVQYLGPQLKKSDPYLKIMMLDDQRPHLPEWTETILGDTEGAKYIDGIGLHWYTEVMDYFAWATKPFEKMTEVHNQYPDKFMLATEACNGFIPYIDQGPKLGNWQRGERYGFDILYDVNAFAVGWTDWNIALDMTGGPNWADNIVDAPILVDTEDGAVFYKNPMFYYLGHFSKFVVPQSKRVAVESSAPLLHVPMETTAFLSPDGAKVIVVVMNRDSRGRDFSLSIEENEPSEGRGYINAHIPGNSIQTFVLLL